jgi:hypothetical protein
VVPTYLLHLVIVVKYEKNTVIGHILVRSRCQGANGMVKGSGGGFHIVTYVLLLPFPSTKKPPSLLRAMDFPI